MGLIGREEWDMPIVECVIIWKFCCWGRRVLGVFCCLCGTGKGIA